MTSKSQSKVPEKWPEWVCKASWDATAVKIIVRAPNETEAWDKAWKKVARMEGGDSCKNVVVLRRIDA